MINATHKAMTNQTKNQTGRAASRIGQSARKDAIMASTSLPIFSLSTINAQGIRAYGQSLIAARRWLLAEGASGLTFRSIRSNGRIVETTLGQRGGIQHTVTIGQTVDCLP